MSSVRRRRRGRQGPRQHTASKGNLPASSNTESRYGVVLICVPNSSPATESFLVAEGKDVLTFGQNHPQLGPALPTFRRLGRAATDTRLVTITPSQQSSSLPSNHKQRVVITDTLATYFPPACVSHLLHRIVLCCCECGRLIDRTTLQSLLREVHWRPMM